MQYIIIFGFRNVCQYCIADEHLQSGANYMAGITYRAKKDTINALEALGWAARDIKYRSVAYAQMAELYLATKNYGRSRIYAHKALDFNTYNLSARKVLAVAARKKEDKKGLDEEIAAIAEIAPLDPFVQVEKEFMEGQNPTLKLTNEFPSETLLALAIEYERLGLPKESLQILDRDEKNTKNKLWRAFLLRNMDTAKSEQLLKDSGEDSVDFVFPYRRETVPVLEWAVQQTNNWKFKYYLAQNFLAVGRTEKGKSILQSLAEVPDSDVFYRFRAKMTGNEDFNGASEDLKKALELKPKDWKVWEENIQFYLKNDDYGEAYRLSEKAYTQFPKNYTIGLAHAKAMLNTDRFAKVIPVLNDIQVLPYEHASESREIYERAHVAVAKSYLEEMNYEKAIQMLEKSKEWPENIGVGKPYNPDERAQNYLLAMALERTGKTDKSKELFEQVITYTQDHISDNSLNHLYGLLAMKKLRGTELVEMISKLKNQTGTNSARSEWALNVYENNSKKLKTLEFENWVPKDVREVAAWALKQ